MAFFCTDFVLTFLKGPIRFTGPALLIYLMCKLRFSKGSDLI